MTVSDSTDDGAGEGTGGSDRPALPAGLLDHATTTGDEGSMPVEEPYTGTVFAEIPTCGGAAVDRAVGRAREAGEAWADRPAEARAAVIERFHDLLLDRQAELLDVLQVETGNGPVRARADEGGVQIVVQNLLSNAIKYTDEGGRIRVRTYEEDGRAAVEVEDTGIGMDPEVAEGLFEPFRQASEGISREYEGTGIGLAVTREAVAQMGGSIEVDTQKGQGTCMTVRLPLAGAAGAA